MNMLSLVGTIAFLLVAVSLTHTGDGTKPVFTIQSPDGDIIDCININEQPSFNDPLLKDHQIQLMPTEFSGMGQYGEGTKWQIWHQNGTECPEGTIPIRRITTQNPDISAAKGHEYAYGFIRHPPSKIYGTTATMNVWQPEIEEDGEFSLGQIWLVSGSYDNNELNSIEAGWQVFPHLYSDNQPRFFIFWTRDAYTDTRCYNLRCAGFVQTSRTVVIEGAISPTSVYGGTQTELTIQIWKDPNLAVWWLAAGFNNGTVISPIGYWPTEIYTRLTEYAEAVQWGGEIVNQNAYGRHTNTQMGSGYLPEVGLGKAAYVRDIGIVVNKTTFLPAYDLGVGQTNPTYYRAKKRGNTCFYYGGQDQAGDVGGHGKDKTKAVDMILLYISLGFLLFF